jgi:hypothetical protein
MAEDKRDATAAMTYAYSWLVQCASDNLDLSTDESVDKKRQTDLLDRRRLSLCIGWRVVC